MENPQYVITQHYIDPESNNKCSKEIAIFANENLANLLLDKLREEIYQIGESNIEFTMVIRDEHPDITKKFLQLGEWFMTVVDAPAKIPNDMELGQYIRESYNRIVNGK
jgi:hypothetical protein